MKWKYNEFRIRGSLTEMSGENKTGQKPESAASKAEDLGKKAVATAKEKVEKKQWKNPALRMMGIPRFSLPSRNWMIFWTVLASIGGGIAYDKYEQKQVRKKWMAEVEHLSKQVYPQDRTPRKLTIYIAPPPDDFLDESLRLFRKFIKPVLNSASLDYEIFSESRQGDIRQSVAQKIRQMRLDRLDSGVDGVNGAGANSVTEETNSKTWTSFAGGAKLFQKSQSGEIEDEQLVKRSELYKPRDVMGLYRVFKPMEEVKSEDEINPEEAGGVICIGRGAYKEYLAGVHEGLLGPLVKPQVLIEEEEQARIAKEKEKEERIKEGKPAEDLDDDDDEAGTKKLPPVTKSFIQPSEYAAAQLAPELNMANIILNDKNVPVVFEQPVYVYPIPKLTGFLKIPQKIYKYFTTRRLADDFGRRTTSIVYNLSRPYEFKDTLLAKEEEAEWPKKWVAKGIEKNSEWVQELEVDERITDRMRVYDPELLKNRKSYDDQN